MTREGDFFKENFPEYVTDKGEFLSPYWDLFQAGVICATFELKEENTELKEKLNNLASVAEVRLANWQKYEKENTELEEQISTKDIQIKELQEQKVYWKESSFDWRHKFFEKGSTKRLVKKSKQLTKARDLILNLYNAGRDVLMCRNEELAYTRLDNAINDKRIEQFLKECE